MSHALLECSAFAADDRAGIWPAAIEQEVGVVAVEVVRAMPPERQVAALLGDAQWGDRAHAADGAVSARIW